MANTCALIGSNNLRLLLFLSLWLSASVGVADFVPVGQKWGPSEFGTGAVVTWSLRPTEPGPLGPTVTALEEFMPVGFETELQAAFATWSHVANVTFVQVEDTGPGGSDIRVGGQNIDGLNGTLAFAYYPTTGNGTNAGDIYFDTSDPWDILPGASGFDLREDIYQVATHEIAHSIGLEHSVGVPSIVGARNSGYRGLLPADIAGAQYIYGAATGYVAPPQANTMLTLTPNSEIQISFSAFDGGLVLTDTASLTGDLLAFIGQGGMGDPTQLGFRGGNIQLGDMDYGLIDPLIEIDGDILDAIMSIVSANDLTVGPGGQFDAVDTVLGLVDGDFTFNVASPPLGLDALGDYEFFTEPLSLPFLLGDSMGTLVQTPTGLPNEYNVLLQLPLALSTTVDVSFLAPDIPTGFLEITIDITGNVEAAGVVVVPEPATWALMLVGFCCLGINAARRRPRSATRI